MATTAGKLADDLGVRPEQVLQACRQAGLTVLGEQTPLDDREAARVQAVLRVPPQQWPIAGASSGAPPQPFTMPATAAGSRQVPIWLVAVLAVVALAAVVGAGIVLTGTSGDDDTVATPAAGAASATSAPADAPATTGTTMPPAPLVGLAVGECWNDPAVTDFRDGGDTAITEEVPCAGPHHAEVYALVYHPAPQRAPFPGDEALRTFASDQCAIRFAGFVGRPLEESTLNSISVFPTERAWLLEDRTIECSVYALDGSMLTGSMAGANR